MAMRQLLNDMVENDAKYYPNNRSIVEAAGRGEIDMGLVNHYYNYQEAAALGSEHRAVNYDFPSDDIGSLTHQPNDGSVDKPNPNEKHAVTYSYYE